VNLSQQTAYTSSKANVMCYDYASTDHQYYFYILIIHNINQTEMRLFYY